MHKLILSTSKMAERVEQDMHWLKENALFIIWLANLYYSVKSFNFSMRCRLYPSLDLFMAYKGRYSLCINRASLDHVSWTSKTHHFERFISKSPTRIEHDGWTFLMILRTKSKSKKVTYTNVVKNVSLCQL